MAERSINFLGLLSLLPLRVLNMVVVGVSLAFMSQGLIEDPVLLFAFLDFGFTDVGYLAVGVVALFFAIWFSDFCGAMERAYRGKI